MKIAKLCIRLVLLLACSFPTVLGQSNEGSISGNVVDTSGAVVADAKISAKNVASGTMYETVSSSSGSYRLANLNVGTYDVTVNIGGFKTAVLSGVVVQVGTVSSLDITLQIGAVTETVTVDADAPTVQSETADIGTVVTSKQVLDLPLALGSVVQAMRSPEAFVFLTPGTVGPGTASGNGGTFESKISGGQNYSTEVLLDGASTYRSENGSSFDETAPSVDALGEFRVTTSTMPPEMGRTTGGIESFTTKSGTNDIHGSAYDIFRNEAMDANTFFNNNKGLPRPLDRQNDYGLTLGGPVWIPKVYNGKNKSFFFFAWEQYRQNQGGVSNITVPTTAQRAGDFSATLNTANVLGINPCDGTPIFEGQVFDPATTQTVGGLQCRTAFPGNIVPQDRWSTVAQNILAFYPEPQNSNAFNNFAFPFSFPILDTTTTFRFDHNLSTRHKLYFTYSSRDNARTSTTPIFDNPAGQGRFQDFFTHYIRVGWDFTLSPTKLNHLNLGYNRTNSLNVGAGVKVGGNLAAALGISGTAGDQTPGTPFPTIGVFEGPLTQIGDDVYGDAIDNGYRINDTFEWVKGKHDFKFGVDYRFQLYSPLGFGRTTGQYFFQRQQTAATPLTAGLSGNAIASFLLGDVHDSNLDDYASQPRYFSDYFAVFFQDSFKLKPTLTINLGLRWDIDRPRRETHGNTSNIDLNAPNPGADGFPGALVIAGVGSGRTGNVDERWAKTWFKDFGPRIGFAWTPARFNNKLVVRGGYGIFYGALLYADFGGFNRAGFTANPAFNTPDGFSPAFQIDSGFPAYPAPPNLDPAQLNFQGPQYVDPSYGRPPMINNWSLEVQHELATDLILDVAYVAQRSTHLRTNFDAQNSLNPQFFSLGSLLNQQVGSPQAQAAGIQLPFPSFPTDRTVAQSLVPLPQYLGFNTDGALENLGQSSYNSLQASLQRRFRNGLNLMVSYTFSKTLTDADAALPFFATLHGGGSAQNPFDKKGEKAISNQDIPHILVLSYLYELPIGHGKRFVNTTGWKDKAIGGWQIGGVQRYQSGQPLSFCCATGVPAFSGAIRFNRVAGESLQSSQFKSGSFNPVTDPLFNAAAFSDPNDPARIQAGGAYAFGDMARTTGEVRMFKFLSEDFSLIKKTSFNERVALSFQASIIDAFNRHIFNRPPDLNPRDPSFSVLDTNNTVLGPRKIQLELKLLF
jgi:Carboxypeptidase regulatory-like domain